MENALSTQLLVFVAVARVDDVGDAVVVEMRSVVRIVEICAECVVHALCAC